MLIENLSINVTPGGIPVTIHISQYDIGLRTFVFSPYTSHGTFTPDSAAAATLEGTKPDGNVIIHNCHYNSTNGQITYTVQEQLAAVAGKVWSKLTLRDTSGNAIGYTAIIWVVDMAGVQDGAIASDSDISALQQFIAEFGTINAYKSALNGALAAVGGPYVASTVSQMTDHSKVYVYTGSQTGYTAGHWYYWDGSAWTDGGVYQAAAVETDKTLTVADMAADAKVTGGVYDDVINTASACSEVIETQIASTGTGNYVKWDNGYISPNANFDSTTYTDISKYKYLLYTDTAGTGASPAFGIAFYTNKTVGGYISGVQSYGKRNTPDYAYRVIKIPDNAVYARFTMFAIATSIPFAVRGFYDIDDIKNDIDNIDAQIENNVYATCDLFDSFVIGGISVNGAATTDTTRARTYKALEVPENAYISCDPSLEYRIVYYTSNSAYRDTFDSVVPEAFTSDPIDLTPGKYAKFLVRYKADPTQVFTDVSGLKDLINIKYKIASNDIKPLNNIYLSLMGDSISALAGYIPEGNAAYYNGSNHGITDVSQMWWDVLCQKTGMIRCVINAWSGSGVTQLYDSAHINRTPMSDPSRCGNLRVTGMNPDVIIIAGGTNDYTYAEQSSQEPLPWDGLTAPQDLTSFTQQYAIMIHQIQTNYPDAIIVCCSTFFTMRGDDNGYTRTHTVGSNTYTQDDYDNAIKHVCGLMGVPYLEIRNIGFNQNNYYPKYAPDSATIPTHPNAAGHAIIGNAVAEKIVNLVKGYCDNIVH